MPSDRVPSDKAAKRRKSPKCKTCGQTIRIPKGWSVGPAVRRHYWAKHRDVMQPDLTGR